MDTSKLMTGGIAAAALFAIAKFVPHPTVKAAALGALGVVVLKTLPIPCVSNAV